MLRGGKGEDRITGFGNNFSKEITEKVIFHEIGRLVKESNSTYIDLIYQNDREEKQSPGNVI